MPIRYSHPPEDGHDGVLLREHLTDVAARVPHVVSEDARTPDGESVQSIVETLAHVHDIGKATQYFQQYIGTESGEPERKRHRYHAPLGAFAAYYALDTQGYETETCVAGLVAVGKHHGRLPNVASYVFERGYRDPAAPRSRQAVIADQILDIDERVPQLADDVFRTATNGAGSWSEFRDGFPGLLDELVATVSTGRAHVSSSPDALSASCYGLALECWGSLVLADKTSAATARNGTEPSAAMYEPDRPEFDRLEEYVAGLEAEVSADRNGTRSERLNYLRSQARESILANARSFADDGPGVATLTLPTGMGKTLSGLSAALAIRDELGHDRIVYALPFTSIIDQVAELVRDVYGSNQETTQTDGLGRLLAVDHHLAETTIADEGEADRNDEVAGMLAEGWRAGLTVTTFVQLFESLAGPTNRQSMKIPALRDAVVILDEPQSLPLGWWKLVPRLVALLVEQFDATVVAMTATQPRLFDDATELVEDPDSYFETTERVGYELDESVERYLSDQTGPTSYSRAAATLADELASGNSTLAVCNTIDSARVLTDHVTDERSNLTDIGRVYADAIDGSESVDPKQVAANVIDAGTQSILHLSTRLRPLDRLRLIEVAKRLSECGHPSLVVSTQLIEAGVDISFDTVYRDLAPIDSIVQAAGRCNRSFERDRGRVTVWWLDVPEEQQKTPAEAVYNRSVSLLPVVAETLADVRSDDESLTEKTVARTAVESYYERLDCEKDVGKQAYATYVDEARGDELGELSLIDQRRAVDVVVCRTPDERAMVESVREAVERYDFDTVSELMDELRSRRISVPVYQPDSQEAKTVEGLPSIHSEVDVRYVDTTTQEYDGFFDPTTGFVVPDSTVERRFL